MSTKIIDTTIISPNLRINLPSDARRILDVVPGDRVIVVHENNEIIIRKA